MQLDVNWLIRLEKLFLGEPVFSGKEFDLKTQSEPPWSYLIDAGIDPRQDLKTITLAISRQNNDILLSIILKGRFESAGIRNYLRRQFQGRIIQQNEPFLIKLPADPNGCWPKQGFYVAVGSTAIMGFDARLADRILNSPKDSLAFFQQWNRFRRDRLFSLAARIPREVKDNATVQAAGQELEQVEQLLLGIAVDTESKTGEAVAELIFDTEAAAVRLNRRWNRKLSRQAEELADAIPAAVSLLKRLTVARQGNRLTAKISVSPSVQTQLQNTVRQSMEQLSEQFNFSMKSSAKEPEPDIVKNPFQFTSLTKPYTLGRYQGSEPVDTVAGPFGVRAEELELLDETLHLTIGAFAGGIPNLGPDSRRATLRVDRVEDKTGRQLLATADCSDEAHSTVLTWRPNAPSIRGDQRLELVADAASQDLQRVSGRILLNLPTSIERIVLEKPAVGDGFTRPGLALRITDLSDTGFGYQIWGSREQVLAVRVRNPAGNILDPTNRLAAGFPFLPIRAIKQGLDGQAAQIEVVLAQDQHHEEYPFHLESPLPGWQKSSQLADKTRTYTTTSVEQFRNKWQTSEGTWRRLDIDNNEAALGRVGAGPFWLRWNSKKSFLGNALLDFDLRAPTLLALDGVQQGVRFQLEEVLLTDGTRLSGDREWSQILKLESHGDETMKEGISPTVDADPDEIQALQGKLVINLPTRIETWILDPVYVGRRFTFDDHSILIKKRDRRGIELELDKNPQLLGIRAFDRQGQPLQTGFTRLEQDDDQWELIFWPTGFVSRIEIDRAGDVEQLMFPFQFSASQ